MKKGSATLVIIMYALVFMLGATSAYADVRHLRNKFEEYEKDIISNYDDDLYNKTFNIGG